MDARDADTAVAATRGVLAAPAALRRAPVACLLIDGRPHWVWIAPADVELL
jgi:hypothetical protein